MIGTPMLDFSAVITDRTRDFTGREWLFAEIDRWLGDPAGPRFFLITGEPGSGKTAIAARLAQFSAGLAASPAGLPRLGPGCLAAVHFCSAHDRRWINPHVFAESLALQLAGRYPAYAQALAERSGERAVRIEVEQRVAQVAGGQLTGVVINTLDVSGVSPEDAFVRVVREPVEAFLGREPDRQVVILVAGLDEALAYSGPVNIADLVARSAHLPPGVRFIVTTAPDAGVLRSLRGADPPPEEHALSEGAGRLQGLGDVRRYVLAALTQRPALALSLAGGLAPDDFTAIVEERSQVNFLYVRYLLQMLEERAVPVTRESLDQLPAGLDGIYLGYLEDLAGGDPQAWTAQYAPLLGVLAVAQAGLTEEQLARFTQIPQPQVRQALRPLRRFLDVDESRPASLRTVALYHRSFAGFLLDGDRAEDYWCEARAQHRRIVDAYTAYFNDRWSACDDYGLDFIVHHILAAQAYALLDQVLTTGFMKERVERARWHMPFVLDLEAAAAVIPPEQVVAQCLQIVFGPVPNSLVYQRVLHLLVQLRPRLPAGQGIGRLGTKGERELDAAVAALGQPAETAAPRLVALLAEAADARVRGLIALALGETGSPIATPALLELLETGADETSWAAADALIALDDRAIIPGLMAMFGDPGVRMGLKQRILYILGRMRAEEARALIVPGLQHPHLKVKAQAINLLWLLAPVENGEEIAWEKLGFSREGVAHDGRPAWSSEWIQGRLVTALGRIGSPAAKAHLERFEREVTARPAPTTRVRVRGRRRLLESIARARQDLERRHPGA